MVLSGNTREILLQPEILGYPKLTVLEQHGILDVSWGAGQEWLTWRRRTSLACRRKLHVPHSQWSWLGTDIKEDNQEMSRIRKLRRCEYFILLRHSQERGSRWETTNKSWLLPRCWLGGLFCFRKRDLIMVLSSVCPLALSLLNRIYSLCSTSWNLTKHPTIC